MEGVVFGAAINGVVAAATKDGVVSIATGDEVVVVATKDGVGAAETIDVVPCERGAAVDEVGGIGSVLVQPERESARSALV